MSSQRATFAKRQRESDLKDKARAKEARRAAKRGEVRTTKGPEIAWDEAVREEVSPDDPLPATPPPDSATDDAT
jgi:hypothetical protein